MVNDEDGLSIVLPVYNEESNIREVVEGVFSVIGKITDNFEIIAIDDGSNDNSLVILRKIALSYPLLRIIQNSKNIGYGAAIRRGITAAQMDWFLFMDADGQFRIDSLKEFWKIRKSYDFIIGYRAHRSDGIYRRILGQVGNIFANFFMGSNIFIKDITCGFKLFKTEDLKNIPLISTGGVINFEVLSKLFKLHKVKFIQLPVKHYSRLKGVASGGNIRVILVRVLEFIRIILSNAC